MPIYEFECPKCGKRYEKLIGINGEKRHICPTCHKRANRVYSTFRTIVDFRDGWDVGLGEYVNTKKDRERMLREKGLMKQDKPDEGRWV